MTEHIDRRDAPREVEINLSDGAKLDLPNVEIDADENPISFVVEGLIHEIDEDILEQLNGKSLKPVAVRFEVDDP